MGKLRLKLDVGDLRVESFEAGEDGEKRGTVHGNALTTIQAGCKYLTAVYDCCRPTFTDDEVQCQRLYNPTDFCSTTTA